jgi:phosphoglycolate phosphatase
MEGSFSVDDFPMNYSTSPVSLLNGEAQGYERAVLPATPKGQEAQKTMQWRAVLFDLDGTLLDTLEDLASAVNRVLSSRGFPTHPSDAYRFFAGDGSWNMIKRALPDGVNNETVEQLVAEYKDEYSRHWADQTRPYPGICALLEGLGEMHLKTAVLTNKYQEFAELVIERFFPADTLHPVIGMQDGLPLKPDPAGAFLAARTLSVDPGRILYVGDSNVDMRTALGAGMYPVGVLWGFRPARELEQTGARLLLKEPEELLDFIRLSN